MNAERIQETQSRRTSRYVIVGTNEVGIIEELHIYDDEAELKADFESVTGNPWDDLADRTYENEHGMRYEVFGALASGAHKLTLY